MNHTYIQPTIIIENLMVERGFADSPYGEAGVAGQSSDYIDYGDDALL